MRIEAEKDGIVYSSLYDDDVRVSVEGGLVTASGKLRDENAGRCPAENRAIVLLTRFQGKNCAFGRSLMTER